MCDSSAAAAATKLSTLLFSSFFFSRLLQSFLYQKSILCMYVLVCAPIQTNFDIKRGEKCEQISLAHIQILFPRLSILFERKEILFCFRNNNNANCRETEGQMLSRRENLLSQLVFLLFFAL